MYIRNECFHSECRVWIRYNSLLCIHFLFSFFFLRSLLLPMNSFVLLLLLPPPTSSSSSSNDSCRQFHICNGVTSFGDCVAVTHFTLFRALNGNAISKLKMSSKFLQFEKLAFRFIYRRRCWRRQHRRCQHRLISSWVAVIFTWNTHFLPHQSIKQISFCACEMPCNLWYFSFSVIFMLC